MNGIQRIQNQFAKGKLYIGYLTVGDGGIQRTIDAALALIEGGVNLIEMGMPFSDPTADGPVIQRACARAVAASTTIDDIITLTQAIRKKSDIPLILFSYLNPVLSALNTNFFAKAHSAGMDGALIVDCPIEESSQLQDTLLKYDMAPIYVITPTTPLDRMQLIDHQGKGFLYYACRKGTTGVRSDLPNDFGHTIQQIKSNAHLPVVVGFGISTREAAEKVLQYADGVVVGSLFVGALEKGINPSELTKLALSINPLVTN